MSLLFKFDNKIEYFIIFETDHKEAGHHETARCGHGTQATKRLERSGEGGVGVATSLVAIAKDNQLSNQRARGWQLA